MLTLPVRMLLVMLIKLIHLARQPAPVLTPAQAINTQSCLRACAEFREIACSNFYSPSRRGGGGYLLPDLLVRFVTLL